METKKSRARRAVNVNVSAVSPKREIAEESLYFHLLHTPYRSRTGAWRVTSRVMRERA